MGFAALNPSYVLFLIPGQSAHKAEQCGPSPGSAYRAAAHANRSSRYVAVSDELRIINAGQVGAVFS